MPSLQRIALACALTSAVCATASAKVERTVEKTFTVQPGVLLSVGTSGGEIRITNSNDGTVHVVAKERIRASSEAEADTLLQDLELTIEQRGNEIVATSHYKSMSGIHFGSWPPVQVDFEISAPKSAKADLKTSGGDIIVADLDGELKAHTSGGEVKLGKMGADVNASTSGGDIEVELAGGMSHLSTSGGNVSVGRVVGPSELKTSGGDIRVESVENTLDADTSGGNVRAGFQGALKGDCYLSTSGGEVKATLGSKVALHLDARTSGGDVNANGVTIKIDHGGVGKSSLSGDVNGGGPLLKLRTSGGDIEVISRTD